MSSTNVFYGAGTTLTVHMPRGSSEAVLMIEGLDNVASITLPLDQVRDLLATLQTCALQAADPDKDQAQHDVSLT